MWVWGVGFLLSVTVVCIFYDACNKFLIQMRSMCTKSFLSFSATVSFLRLRLDIGAWVGLV